MRVNRAGVNRAVVIDETALDGDIGNHFMARYSREKDDKHKDWVARDAGMNDLDIPMVVDGEPVECNVPHTIQQPAGQVILCIGSGQKGQPHL